MEAVGLLTGGMAQDFNLLMAVGGNLQLLGERLPEDQPSPQTGHVLNVSGMSSRPRKLLRAFRRACVRDRLQGVVPPASGRRGGAAFSARPPSRRASSFEASDERPRSSPSLLPTSRLARPPFGQRGPILTGALQACQVRDRALARPGERAAHFYERLVLARCLSMAGPDFTSTGVSDSRSRSRSTR